MKFKKDTGPAVALRPAAATALMLATSLAQATAFDVGNDDVSLRWDNTFKYSNAFRVKEANSALLVPNGDDGDRNFKRGLISNRLDMLSELDVNWKNQMGARISGAAWYDSVYNTKNDNPGFAGGAFPNNVSVPYNEFNNTARVVHGRNVELLDAFVFGKTDLGEESAATLRLGKHSLIWGESVFFGANAIAGGQMPVDAVKLVSVPNTQFKEAIRPVPQISGQVQINSVLSLGAYYQATWTKSRLPIAGSYFSPEDVVSGGESIFVGPNGERAFRQPDRDPKNSGQGGVQLRLRALDTDFGLYAIRFHSKTPQLVPNIGLTPAGPAPTSYYVAYQQGITAFGASASHTVGDFNFAVEGSIRHNQDLASTQGGDLSGVLPVAATNNTSNPGYAVGRTAHINISTVASLDRNPLWNEANLTAEVAWNHLLSITKNPQAIDPNGTRNGFAVRFVLEPTYRSVFPGVDIGVPVGVGWAPRSSRPLGAGSASAWTPAGGGDVTIGLNASYHDAWRFTLAYTHYYGAVGPLVDATMNNGYSWKQTTKDRDFIAASLRYSF